MIKTCLAVMLIALTVLILYRSFCPIPHQTVPIRFEDIVREYPSAQSLYQFWNENETSIAREIFRAKNSDTDQKDRYPTIYQFDTSLKERDKNWIGLMNFIAQKKKPR